MDEVLKALIDRLLPRGTLPRFSQQGALTEIIIAGDSRTYIGWGDGWAAWHEDRGWVQELVSPRAAPAAPTRDCPRCSIKSSREIAPGLRPSSIIRARSSAYRHVGSSSTTRSPKAQEWRWAGAFSILRSRPEGQLRLSRPCEVAEARSGDPRFHREPAAPSRRRQPRVHFRRDADSRAGVCEGRPAGTGSDARGGVTAFPIVAPAFTSSGRSPGTPQTTASNGTRLRATRGGPSRLRIDG